MAHIMSNLMFFMIFLDKPSLLGHDGNEVSQKVRGHWHLCLYPLNTGMINGYTVSIKIIYLEGIHDKGTDEWQEW